MEFNLKQSLCTITYNVEIMPAVHLMWLEAPDIAFTAQPGQFVTVLCEDLTLRRPFSIHQVAPVYSPLTGEYKEWGNHSPCHPLSGEGREGDIAILFKVVGKGTFWLSQRQSGDKLDILGPLGNGFGIDSNLKNLLLVAGGIGIAPLTFLMQRALSQHSITLIHGANTAAHLYPSSSFSFPGGVQYIPVTEDGTIGKRGMATDGMPDFLSWADQIYACGPVAMYKAVADLICHSEPSISRYSEGANRPKNLTQGEFCKESKLKQCQVSLELRLGCGIGACYGCTINTRSGLKQVCHDGPVLEFEDIIWHEVRI